MNMSDGELQRAFADFIPIFRSGHDVLERRFRGEVLAHASQVYLNELLSQLTSLFEDERGRPTPTREERRVRCIAVMRRAFTRAAQSVVQEVRITIPGGDPMRVD